MMMRTQADTEPLDIPCKASSIAATKALLCRLRERLPLFGFLGAGKSVLTLAVLLTTLLLVQGGAPAAEPACVGQQVGPGADLDAIVNADPATKPSTFCIQAGTYQVDNSIKVRDGDKLLGEPGTLHQRGPALDPDPVVKIVNTGDLSRVLDASGNARVEWLEIQGSASGARYTDDTPETCINWGEASDGCPANGTGMAIAAGNSGPDSVFKHLELHTNPANCITGVSGKLFGSELYNCSQNADYWGFSAGALKTINEAEVARNFVHDNEAVGLWCDQGCRNTPARSAGFWVHDNLVVNNGRAGVRYEFSPMPGQASKSSALVEHNRLAGNDWGGAHMHDAQNATFRRNVFGPQTVDGAAYGHNGSGAKALQFTSSGRNDRTKLRNGSASRNRTNGEIIAGCDKPEAIVDCRRNRR